MCDIFTKFVIF